jgi:hypothetical protein
VDVVIAALVILVVIAMLYEIGLDDAVRGDRQRVHRYPGS